MVDSRKEYFIKIFLKKCIIQSISKEQLDYKIKWCELAFDVPKNKAEELKKKYTLDEYINKMIPVIDGFLTVEDLQNLIKFYSSDVGKKMLDPLFFKEIEKVVTEVHSKIEQDFKANGRI